MSDFGNQWQFSRTKAKPAGVFATGKNAVAICDRCGWKRPWTALRTEPGTGWKVCSECNDGQFSLVAHPQNYPANVQDAIALRWARPDQTPAINGPWYLADENGDVLEWGQEIIIQTGTSSGGVGNNSTKNSLFPNVRNWQSPPYGYD